MTLPISKDIVDLQDIEKIQFLTALQADPAKYAEYVGEKKNRIMAESVDTKRASFVKVSADMARMMDMDHNSMASLQRTNELISTDNAIIAEQQKQLNATSSNNDLTRRQVEINNWYYENKRETLFVLQFVLLIVLSVVVVLYLAHAGWLAQDGADYVIGFVLVVGAGTWMYRWYYTAYVRDARYWNQRTFTAEKKLSGSTCPPEPEPPAPVMPTCPAGSVFDATSGMCISITTASVAPTCPDGMTYSVVGGTCM
jgi:hypothetical protein